jgi:triosephosphate isomerase
MIQIFVNLKRFEVPRRLGGLCPQDDPNAWVRGVVADSLAAGLGSRPTVQLTYLLPEGLVAAAAAELAAHPENERAQLAVGVQGVHWQDIAPGQNFGAFTSSLPAAAAANLGATWALIGHSEERRAKLQVLQAFEPHLDADESLQARAAAAVDDLVGQEAACALGRDLRVLLCVGETAAERGAGDLAAQQGRIEAVLRGQLTRGLAAAAAGLCQGRVVIGYEPVWAIGPGKTPPDAAYIASVSALIQRIGREAFGVELPVVYGGGLKEENAAAITGIDTIAGGLVGLTRFSGEIGFDVPGLVGIIARTQDQEAA